MGFLDCEIFNQDWHESGVFSRSFYALRPGGGLRKSFVSGNFPKRFISVYMGSQKGIPYTHSKPQLRKEWGLFWSDWREGAVFSRLIYGGNPWPRAKSRGTAGGGRTPP
jgi:hypothetical protein